MPKRKVTADEVQQNTRSLVNGPEASTPKHTRRTRASESSTIVPDENIPKRTPNKRRKIKIETEVETIEAPASKTKKATRIKTEKVSDETSIDREIETTTVKKQKIKQDAEEYPGNTVKVEIEEKKVKKKRKTKEEKEAEAMPLAARTVGHRLFVGAHVSASGGVHKAVPNAVRIGGNAFALFLKSQRKWSNPALSDEVAESYHSACDEHHYDSNSHVVPHGSYLVNLAHTDEDRTTQAYDSFLDDLQRCERLGIELYNFHPGNTAGKDRATAIKHLATNLNKAHKATASVVTLLENMAAAGGNVIGTTFEDLRDIISHVEDKSRVGVCLDTCHAFAAGYDLRSPEEYAKTMQKFDEVIGIGYLRALHLNDSKAPLGARRDLHANIGTGFLGLRAFHNVANDLRLAGLPLVLETPISMTDEDGEPLKDEKGNEKSDANIWAREIKLIESLTDMDTASTTFLELEKSLARKGAKERKRIADQADRRKDKEAKLAAKGKSKKSKKESNDDGSDLSELEEE